MTKKKIYIAGKITGLSKEEVIMNFNASAYFIDKSDDYVSVNPIEIGIDETGGNWKDYLAKDIRMLLDCQAIYLTHGWEDSRGAKIEYGIALALGMDVIKESKEDKEELIKIYKDENKVL